MVIFQVGIRRVSSNSVLNTRHVSNRYTRPAVSLGKCNVKMVQRIGWEDGDWIHAAQVQISGGLVNEQINVWVP